MIAKYVIDPLNEEIRVWVELSLVQEEKIGPNDFKEPITPESIKQKVKERAEIMKHDLIEWTEKRIPKYKTEQLEIQKIEFVNPYAKK